MHLSQTNSSSSYASTPFARSRLMPFSKRNPDTRVHPWPSHHSSTRSGTEHAVSIRYNRQNFEIFHYNIYAVCGDGCLMEGVASEAASLAGHLGLDNLCWIYDNNHISLEGSTQLAFTEDVASRFLAYGWNILRVGDANDIDAIQGALEAFMKTKGRPTFITLDSHIGYGSPHKQDTAAAHGDPLGDEEVRLTKRNYGWPENETFLVPD